MKSFKIIDQHGETIAGFDSTNHAVTFLASYKKREENDQCSITLRGTDLALVGLVTNKLFRY